MTCPYCNGTSKYEKPLDEERFADYFLKFYESGLYSIKMAREMALLESGTTEIACPYCENGIYKYHNIPAVFEVASAS